MTRMCVNAVRLCISLTLAGSGLAAEESIISADPTPGVFDESLQHELDAAVNRGLDWLAANQAANGAWSNTNFPALTAFPLWAFARTEHPQREAVMRKAVAFLKSCVQPDGGIYQVVTGVKGGGLSNYNTAICMTALHAVGDPELTPIVLNARAFVAGAQHVGDDAYRGGFGYDKDTNRAYTDLMNTLYAMEAMRLTQGAEDLRPGGKKVDIDWSAAVKFVEGMQNKPGSGKDQAGGFFYRPGESKAGTVTDAKGHVVFRSYGSMTYAGLLALVYARVDRDDIRVRSAFQWSCENWSLDENPGMGNEGMFFFYDVLARALRAYGAELIPRGNNVYVDWRSDLVEKLIACQHVDPKTGAGYWLNPTGRFWEQDPVLVTGYSLLSLLEAQGQ